MRIEETFDFEEFVKPLERYYCEDNGRPAIHPEIIVRALLIAAIYQIPSFRALVARIKKNLAFRYFLHLGLADEVFDHSTISVFIERVGETGFKRMLKKLNENLVAWGLISDDIYLDSTLVKANVAQHGLEPTEKSLDEFVAEAICKNDLFVSMEKTDSTIKKVHFQDSKGRLRLSEVDLDARWARRDGHSLLAYKESVAVSNNGFFLALKSDHANIADSKAALDLLDELPLAPNRITADGSYAKGAFREKIDQKKALAFIPL